MDTLSKENMQLTIKNLEDRILNIEKIMEKGSDCLIFQYGSQSIKYNRANEIAPKKILNLIAYKKLSENIQEEKHQEKQVQEQYEQFDQQLLLLESKLKQQGLLKSEKITCNIQVQKGKPRGKLEVDLKFINQFIQPNLKEQEISLCPFQKDIDQKNIIFEDEIFFYENRSDYIIKQPIKYGFLNEISSINDLYRLTVYCITKKLGIAMQALNKYNCILVVPDVFQRQQIKLLVDMLFRQFGFKQVYLHLESVLAQFGVNNVIGCIVDIGYEKINISCVDEGVIIPGTFIRKNFGSKDLDLALLRLISKKNTFKKGFKLDQRQLSDLYQISKLKESATQITPKEDKLNHLYEMHTIRDGHEEKFSLPYSETLCLPAHLLFDPDPLNILKRNNDPQYDFTSRVFEMYYDPEDNMEELSGGVQLSWCWGSKEKEQQFWSQPEVHAQLHPSVLQPLDQMVCTSIAGVYDQEQRVKIAQNIILVGGGAHLADLAEYLEQKLYTRASEMDLTDIEKFEVKIIVREDIRPQCLSWTGASVLPKTESMCEMWISKQKWLGEFEPNDYDDFDQSTDPEKRAIYLAKREKDKEKSNEWGLKHLKEKISFVW